MCYQANFKRSASDFLTEINPHAKRNIFALLFLLLYGTISLNSAAQSNTWLQKSDVGHNSANFPEPPACDQAVGFSIGGKGYIGTGFNDKSLSLTNSFWEYDPTSGTWTQKADFGGAPRIKAVGFSIGDKGYIGTGDAGSYPHYNKDFWEYDPVTNKWTQKADIGGTSRESAVGFSIGDKGYIGTGLVQDVNGGEHYLKDFWEYDPAADTWKKKADFGGDGRDGAVGFSIGSKGYVGTGGHDIYDSKKDFWEYDPSTDAWTRRADFAGGTRYGAVGFSMDGKGYIGTGYDNINFRYAKDFWAFDQTTNSWTQKADYGGPGLGEAVGFSIGSKGYIGTGDDANGFIRKDFWEYDLATDSWTQQKDFGESIRDFAVSFSIGNKGYIGTGSDGGRLPPFSKKDFWEYDPLTDAWSQKADFAGTEREGAVGLSIGSKGYIGTGYDADHYNFLSDFWEYDPVANTWTQKADYAGGVRNGAVAFSIGNKGYVGTGRAYFSDYRSDFWEYDPATDTWTRKADFAGGTRINTVGFSIGSKGYIGTGQEYFQNYKKDFWEYDPATDKWTQKADFVGNAREAAAGFSIGNKGYVGTGDDGDFHYYKDFWEYDPASDNWMQKTDFGGDARHGAVGFSIGNKGYIGTGEVYFEDLRRDLWEYTPSENACKPPSGLSVTNITDSAARLQWTKLGLPVLGYQVVYRPVGSVTWIKQLRPFSFDHINLNRLSPNTTYKWAIRSLCRNDQSEWVAGPDFTTAGTLAIASTDTSRALINEGGQMSVQVMPNPNNGNFTVRIQLPKMAASTTLTLYNNVGTKVWQQGEGRLSGLISRNISLKTQLSTGLFILIVQHGDTRLIQKVVVTK